MKMSFNSCLIIEMIIIEITYKYKNNLKETYQKRINVWKFIKTILYLLWKTSIIIHNNFYWKLKRVLIKVKYLISLSLIVIMNTEPNKKKNK